MMCWPVIPSALVTPIPPRMAWRCWRQKKLNIHQRAVRTTPDLGPTQTQWPALHPAPQPPSATFWLECS